MLPILLLLLAGALLLLCAFKSSKKLPPGPWGLPIIGHLHHISRRPHRDLHRLSQTYGPVMLIRFGLLPTVVVSSPTAVQELYKRHDVGISGRVHHNSADYLAFGSKGLGPSQYGPYYRAVRKLYNNELLSNQKIEWSMPARRKEMALFITSLANSASSRTVVDVSANISYLILDMACVMTLGSKGTPGADMEEVGGLRWIIQEGSQLLGVFNHADYLPFLKFFDLQRLKREMKGLKETTNGFLDKIINDRVSAAKEGKPPKDLADILVSCMVSPEDYEGELRFDRDNVKALIMESLAATVEPTFTTIEWAFTELLKHPEMMRKAQQELKSIVGMSRMVEESDLGKLHYLDMVIKESMRLHTPLPILIPFQTTEDCTVSNYTIPRKSQLIINAWAIGRDPMVWHEPEKFDPERFANSKIDVKGHDFELIPFGFGRRGCPAMQLGLVIARLVLANLVHCFDWELDGVEPDQLDMEEVFAVTAPRSKHLLATPTYRLR